mmetsp:Transcript_33838/g.87780  ORF Transcript_33838/g.87780 Transcript_33838/m.87780 type:complete len:201 (+) Transcript_33838:618-1220(+)
MRHHHGRLALRLREMSMHPVHHLLHDLRRVLAVLQIHGAVEGAGLRGMRWQVCGHVEGDAACGRAALAVRQPHADGHLRAKDLRLGEHRQHRDPLQRGALAGTLFADGHHAGQLAPDAILRQPAALHCQPEHAVAGGLQAAQQPSGYFLAAAAPRRRRRWLGRGRQSADAALGSGNAPNWRRVMQSIGVACHSGCARRGG